MSDGDLTIDPSDEVVNEEEIRKQQAEQLAEIQKAQEAELLEIQKQEQERIKAQIDEHNARIDEAQMFDWDAWEDETGLTRPEIPAKLEDPKT